MQKFADTKLHYDLKEKANLERAKDCPSLLYDENGGPALWHKCFCEKMPDGYEYEHCELVWRGHCPFEKLNEPTPKLFMEKLWAKLDEIFPQNKHYRHENGGCIELLLGISELRRWIKVEFLSETLGECEREVDAEVAKEKLNKCPNCGQDLKLEEEVICQTGDAAPDVVHVSCPPAPKSFREIVQGRIVEMRDHYRLRQIQDKSPDNAALYGAKADSIDSLLTWVGCLAENIDPSRELAEFKAKLKEWLNENRIQKDGNNWITLYPVFRWIDLN